MHNNNNNNNNIYIYIYILYIYIYIYLYNLKNVKNTHGGVLLLVKLQACNFTKSNPPDRINPQKRAQKTIR